MPIPKPKANESRQDFILRCIKDPVMQKEYPNNPQRFMVCTTSYEETKKIK